ncbi:MAG: tetratricopeptide repeat protein [Myxococcales bacterium]|nr:tetratricopeptide repeat protein [Myxococcales bacterium]
MTTKPRSPFALALVLALSACLPRPQGTDDALQQSDAGPAPERLFTHGQHLAASGQPVKGEQYIALAIAAGYPAARAMPALLSSCIASGRLRAALQHAERFLRREPGAWRIRQLAAALRLAFGQPEAAESHLLAVLQMAPKAAESHYLLASLELEYRGDLDAAAGHYATYMRLAPRGTHAAEVRAWLETRRAAQLAEIGSAQP